MCTVQYSEVSSLLGLKTQMILETEYHTMAHHGKYFAGKWDLLKSIRLQLEKLHSSSLCTISLLCVCVYLCLTLLTESRWSFCCLLVCRFHHKHKYRTNIIYIFFIYICCYVFYICVLSCECIPNRCRYCVQLWLCNFMQQTRSMDTYTLLIAALLVSFLFLSFFFFIRSLAYFLFFFLHSFFCYCCCWSFRLRAGQHNTE